MGGKLYCLDTSVFIESWCRLYRPDSFPSFWTKMDEAINQGCLIAPDLVFNEIQRKDDELYEWLSERRSLFHPLIAELQIAQANIVNRFPKLLNEVKNRSLGDPWVIALAQIRSCPVVTEENQSGSENKPRIPDVCNQLGIGVMKVADLIQALGWKF